MCFRRQRTSPYTSDDTTVVWPAFVCGGRRSVRGERNVLGKFLVSHLWHTNLFYDNRLPGYSDRHILRFDFFHARKVAKRFDNGTRIHNSTINNRLGHEWHNAKVQ